MARFFLIAAFALIFIAACAPEEKKAPFCGDNICSDEEKASKECAADCGGFAGITKKQCSDANGKWNDCGSPCAGTGAEFCIQVCSPQCECLSGKNCPRGFKCRITEKDEFGVCVQSG